MESLWRYVRTCPTLSLPCPDRAREAIIARDREFVSPSYTRSYPLVAERGEGAIVEDVDGNRFLDFNAGIAVVATGHCHPRVVAAIREQAGAAHPHVRHGLLLREHGGTGRETVGARPRRRARAGCISATRAPRPSRRPSNWPATTPAGTSSSPSWADSTAAPWGRSRSRPARRCSAAGFGPLVPGVHHIPYAYCYRCAYGKQPETCAVECVKVLEEQVFKTIVPGRRKSPPSCSSRCRARAAMSCLRGSSSTSFSRVAQRHGILLIVDEVQSGMGRTGKMWASEHFDLVPDIMAVAKGIASGLPLAATVARAEIMQWERGAHASTFGGNPVAVAAALTTIELLEEELIENAARMGRYIMERMRRVARDGSACVGDVRGLGLMIGIELVRDQRDSRKGAGSARQDRADWPSSAVCWCSARART